MKPHNEKNILVVNPWICDFKAYDFWIKPLGLLFVSAMLEKNGFNVHLIDCMNRLHPSTEHLVKYKKDGTGKFVSAIIDKPKLYEKVPRKYRRYGLTDEALHRDLDKMPVPDLILVTSMMTYWYPGVHRMIKILKGRYPTTPILLGGVYASLCSDFAREKSGADYIIPRFDSVEFIKMICRLTDKTPVFLPKDFTEYPAPAYHLYPRLEYGVVITSKGCPFNCSYCASPFLSPHFFRKKPEQVADEILALGDEFGIRKIAFYDDALLVDQEKHIIPILEILENSGKKFSFFTPNGLHGRYITQRLAELMFRTGFQQLRVSLESTDENFLKYSGGKVTPGETAKAVETLLSVGFPRNKIGIYLMMGIPGQTFEECNRSIDYVNKLGVQIRLSDYSPVPGTRDYDSVMDLFGEQLKDPLFHNNTYHHFQDWPFSYEQKKYLKEKTFSLNGELLTDVNHESVLPC